MSDTVNRAAGIAPPGVVLPITITMSDTAASFVLPTIYQGRWITLQADGTKCYVRFAVERLGSAAAASIDPADVATLDGSDVATPNVDACIAIPADQERSYDLGLLLGRASLPKNKGLCIRVYHRAPAETGTEILRCWPSDGPVV